MSALLPPGARVLDLGCGEGRDSVFFAQRGFNVTGVDVARSGLAKAERLARGRGVRVRWVCGDIGRLDALRLLEECFDLRDARRDGKTRHVAYGRPHETGEIFPPQPLERAPGKGRKDEIMIIQDILGNSDCQEDIEGFDRRHILPQPEKMMISLVGLATVDRGEEGVLCRFDTARVNGLEIRQHVWPHAGVVNVLIGEGDVLQDREKTILPLQALGEVMHSM